MPGPGFEPGIEAPEPRLRQVGRKVVSSERQRRRLDNKCAGRASHGFMTPAARERPPKTARCRRDPRQAHHACKELDLNRTGTDPNQKLPAKVGEGSRSRSTCSGGQSSATPPPPPTSCPRGRVCKLATHGFGLQICFVWPMQCVCEKCD